MYSRTSCRTAQIEPTSLGVQLAPPWGLRECANARIRESANALFVSSWKWICAPVLIPAFAERVVDAPTERGGASLMVDLAVRTPRSMFARVRLLRTISTFASGTFKPRLRASAMFMTGSAAEL